MRPGNGSWLYDVSVASIARSAVNSACDAQHGCTQPQRASLNRLSALDPAPAIKRHTHEAPGNPLRLDIKKLGRFERLGHRVTGDRQAGRPRGAGRDYVHVAIDDHSRVSHATSWPDEKGCSAVAALIAALRYYRRSPW